VNLLRDLFHRLRLARGWVVAQFAVTLGLILLGFVWTNLPDEHVWQVALILLIVVLLGISALELQAGTMRGLAYDDGKRVKLVWGALTLLVWIAMACAFWAVLDWCDFQIPQWPVRVFRCFRSCTSTWACSASSGCCAGWCCPPSAFPME